MCMCVYVLMHVCSCVLMNLYAYMLMYVTMHMLMYEYANLSMFKYVCVQMLMCSTKLSKALSLSKFYRFLGRKRSEITAFFKTSKQLFQPRFYLSVSPDCKMCVRVTNTGEKHMILVL